MRRPGLATVALLTAWLLAGVFCLPAAASEKSLPADWSAAKPGAKDSEPAFQAGGGPTLSLLYLDVDALNTLIAKANGQLPEWDVPVFSPGQPLVLWGGGGGAGGANLRFGGFGAGGELVEEDGKGAARFTIGYGGVFLHYVLRPGAGSPGVPEPSEPFPGGRVRFTVGGLLGGGGYDFTLTDKAASNRDFPIHRTASQAFALLAPEVGVEFALTPFTHLRLSGTYFYALPVGSTKQDREIHPDPSVLQQWSFNLSLLFGIF